MKNKSFLIATILLLFASTMSGQNYKTGVGVRAGFFNGVSVKSFLSPNSAIEGIATYRWDGVVVTGMYEWQKFIPSAPGFDYYLGIGAHIGFFENYKWSDASVVLGADLVAGLEYTFPTAPFTIALDYKPAFNFIGDNRIWLDSVGLSFRFNLK